MAPASRFVHLHLHSEYSLVDGLVRIKPLVEATVVKGMPAVAVTDQCNLFCLVRFYQAALAAGVKPIAGTDLWVRNPDDATKPYRLLVLVQNRAGYLNLTRLISRGYLQGQHLGVPQVERAWIEAATDGLIALGGPHGDVARALLAGQQERAEALLEGWLGAFGDRYYLELVRTGREPEPECLERSVELAARKGVPVVATNDVRFLAAEDFEAHEARVCIHDGRTLNDPRRPRLYSEEQYLRTPEEMAELFADLPEALENSVEIARRCNLELNLGQSFLPDFPIPEGMTTEEFFAAESRQGLERRLERIIGRDAPDFAERRRVYDERLELELDVINQMGFPGYFLIVADFIRWAKDNEIPVGPGRGSGAGSLVAYALAITDLDPLEHDLLFERFLNPERVSMPDFDVDFCMENRDRVIDYVAGRYGRDAVSQIITFGTLAAKAVVRDVGRVMGHPYGMVDRIAKMVPFELGMTLDKALEESDDLKAAYEDEEEVQAIINLARKLEGLARNAGKHAGGVVIAPTVLTDFAPLYCEPGGENLVTQFDKDDVEQAGLVKFDFLGLRTLTIIDWALKTVNQVRRQAGEPPIEIGAIPMDDADAFALLKRYETTAVFQLESRGMKELIKKLQPDCFDDITALVALFRPGPLQSGMVDDFIDRKHGRAKVTYPHPDLAPILKPTYGIILYQEQVMQIAQVLAGYTLGGADLLRRAMGKKKPAEMAKQRTVFQEGAIQRGVVADTATYIFDLMEKFAGYGFNKTVAIGTRIATLGGTKPIEQFRAGDQVVSLDRDGSLQRSRVVALHDHGQVPVWEVTFHDGNKEICTLDHKWLTRQGQLPLWKIIQLGEQVWGTTPDQALDPCSPKGMPGVHEHDSFGTQCRKGTGHVLRRAGTHPQKGQRALPVLPGMPAFETGHPSKDLPGARTHTGDEKKILGNSAQDISATGYSRGKGGSVEVMAREKSRAIRGDSQQGPCLAQAVENGGLVGATSGAVGIHTQWPFIVRRYSQTSGLYQSAFEDGHRSGWPVALLTDSIRGQSAQGANARPIVGSGGSQAFLENASPIDGMLQGRWRITEPQPGGVGFPNRGWRMGRHIVPRRPVQIRFVGWHRGYDLEVDHPEHNFLLASGLCCSNSHSAAYALVAYQTLWLKAHYPAAFMAAVLSADMDNTDKVVTLIDACREMRLKVMPPAINRSEYRFTIGDEGTILYGIGAIKGVGESAIEAMLQARRKGGPFPDIWDLCRRIDLHKANRRVLEALIRAGALDELGENRATLTAQLPMAVKMAEQHRETAAAGQADLFGTVGADTAAVLPDSQLVARTWSEWEEEQRLQGEKETLGLYLTGHPIRRVAAELEAMTGGRIGALLQSGRGHDDREQRTVAGLVVGVRHGKTQRGRMGSVLLDDGTGRIEATCFSEVYEKVRDLLVADNLLVITGSLSFDDYRDGWSLRADRVRTLEQARAELADHLALVLDLSDPDAHPRGPALIGELRAILRTFSGIGLPVRIHYHCPGARGHLILGGDWRVRPTDELLKRLRQLLGPDTVRVAYERLDHEMAVPDGSPARPRLAS
ncbi:MAG: DNA polymerase III subunit alpha [Candidatus Thiosymbion ectosymbiont of Robbea hypermnestra]|nr:DNA polymerase III subunit alpha [Candidatus Thiosymbion ectosymbiont of Robbea hypermnestra]